MWDTLRRSWEFTKISYRIVWEHKALVIFPLLSTIAAIIVTASFLLPLWNSGQLEQWMHAADEGGAGEGGMGMVVTAFLFYFCNYFVIIFFNSGLTACAMQVLRGQDPTIGDGFSMAAKRIHQIFGWALVSATVGVLLRIIENAHERAGQIIAAILGTAWTAMTYFVVPVIVMEGAGPVEAFKRSLRTLRATWGTALVGHFSLGLIGFLVMLPFILVAVVLFVMASASGSTASVVLAVVLGGLVIAVGAAVTGAADVIFKAVLYEYATGRSLPSDIDTAEFRSAFAPKA